MFNPVGVLAQDHTAWVQDMGVLAYQNAIIAAAPRLAIPISGDKVLTSYIIIIITSIIIIINSINMVKIFNVTSPAYVLKSVYALVDFYWPIWTFHNLTMVIILVITVQQFAGGLWEEGGDTCLKRNYDGNFIIEMFSNNSAKEIRIFITKCSKTTKVHCSLSRSEGGGRFSWEIV